MWYSFQMHKDFHPIFRTLMGKKKIHVSNTHLTITYPFFLIGFFMVAIPLRKFLSKSTEEKKEMSIEEIIFRLFIFAIVIFFCLYILTLQPNVKN